MTALKFNLVMCLHGGGIESAGKYLMEREHSVMSKQRCGSLKNKTKGRPRTGGGVQENFMKAKKMTKVGTFTS